MANKNFEVKHGLSVGGTERITSAGVASFPSLSTTGNLTVGGNLSVTGSTTTADNLVSADKNITLNYHASNDTSGSADGAGITIQDAVNSSTDATLLWDASDDRFKFSHGVEVTSGNVGIGTSSPSRLLDIENSTAGGSTLVSLVSATDGNVQLLMGDTASDTQGKILYNNDGDYMTLNTNDAERIRINSSGNVGIGTTSPGSKFTVEGDMRQTTGDLLYSGGGNWDIKHLTNDQNICFYTSEGGTTSERARIKANGYVGIGVASPDARLTVSGSANSEQMIITGNNNQSRGLSISTRTNDGGTGGQQDAEVFLNAQDTEHASYAALALGYGGNETLRVQQIESSGATGAVGINRTDPAYTLDILTNGESNALRIYQGTGSGKDLSMLLQNAGTGSGDDCLISLYAAAGGGDPKIRWAISGNETWEMGIDNDNSDALKISNSSNLGSTNRLRMAGSTAAWTTSSFTIQNAGDPVVLLTNTSSNQTLRMDHNSARTTTNHDFSILVNNQQNRKLMLNSSSTNNAVDLVGIATSSPQATLHINNSNSESSSADSIVYISKNSSNDWSVRAGGGADNFGYKAHGAGSYAYSAYDHNASDTRYRVSFDGYVYSTDGSIHDIDSDVRLKEEITAAPSQWQMIKDLPLQKFKWIDRRKGDVDSYGWIAQVVEESYPEFVEDVPQSNENIKAGITTDFKTVKTGEIQRRSIAALQEAMTRIETLEAQVSQNLSDINLLKSRIEVLEG